MTAAEIAREFLRLNRMQRDLRIYEERYGDVCAIEWLRRHVADQLQRLSRLMHYTGTAAVVLVLLCMPAVGQQHHHRDHLNYKDWFNLRSQSCCNNQDCGQLDETDERTTGTSVEVRVEGIWCPVQAFHYLMKGNAPNWSTAHVCVQKQVVPGAVPVCSRLLCYQPKPGI